MQSRTYQTSYAGLVALSNQPAPWLWAAAGLVLLALMPAWFGAHGLNILTIIFITSIGILGLNLLSGVAGQISLGHAGFLLIGAYAQAILTTDYKLPTLLAIFVSGGWQQLPAWWWASLHCGSRACTWPLPHWPSPSSCATSCITDCP